MMSCDEAVAALWRHLEDEAAGGDTLALDDHLVRCRRCCGESAFAGMLRDLWVRAAADGGVDELPRAARERFEGTLAALGDAP
jgi:predicted anti-sigma-YlaC factor YlaD